MSQDKEQKEQKKQELYATIMQLRNNKQKNKEICDLLQLSQSSINRIVREGDEKDWDYKGKGDFELRVNTVLQEIEDSRVESLNYFKFLRDVCVNAIKRYKPTEFEPRKVEALSKIVEVARKVELDRITLLGITPPKIEETNETYLNVNVTTVPIEIPPDNN